MSREATVLHWLSDAFGPMTLEAELQASKERHPANPHALAPIPSLFSQPAPSHMAGRPTERTATEGLNIKGLRLAVLGELVRAGAEGRTGVEVEANLNLRRPSGSSRLPELEGWGYVVATTRRRPTQSGRPATVWQVTQEGKRAYEIRVRQVS